MEVEDIAGTEAGAGSEVVETGLDGGEEQFSDLDILNQEDEPEQAEQPTEEQQAGAQEEEAQAAEQTQQEEQAEQTQQEEQAQEEEVPSVKFLKDQLAANPQIKAALDANPALRNRLFADARRSQELTTYKEQFATLELAKHARESAEQFAGIEGEYFSGTPQGFDSLIHRMAEASQQTDANGQIVSNGLIEGFFGHHRQSYFWPAVLDMAKQSGAEEVTEAAEMLMEFLGDKAQQPQQQQAQPQQRQHSNLPPDVRQRLAKLDNLERQQGTQAEQQRQQYEKSVVESVESTVRTMLTQRVKAYAPGLSPEQVEKVIDDTFKDLNGMAGRDVLYQRSWQSMFTRAGGSDEAKKRLVAHAESYAKGVVGPLIQKHVRIFGQAAVQSAQAKQAKLETQKSVPNPKGAGGSSAPIRHGDLHSMIREGEQLSQKLFGRSLSDKEILDIEDVVPTFQRMAQQRAR